MVDVLLNGFVGLGKNGNLVKTSRRLLLLVGNFESNQQINESMSASKHKNRL